jgi:hypothetical protein
MNQLFRPSISPTVIPSGCHAIEPNAGYPQPNMYNSNQNFGSQNQFMLSS